jgi:hypothetical protein
MSKDRPVQACARVQRLTGYQLLDIIGLPDTMMKQGAKALLERSLSVLRAEKAEE